MRAIDSHMVPVGAPIPLWVESIGVAVWITDSRGRIRYINRRAEALFGHSLDDWFDRPCHLVVAGHTRTGPFCGPRCRVRAQAQAHSEIEPVRMEITAHDGERTEVCVVVIAADSPMGTLLVHMVVDDERERLIRGYLEKVVGRGGSASVEPKPSRKPASRPALSRREREVLALLAADANLHEIADRLSISHTTVRNHVQHILSKLGVHSILEAVAVWLVDARPRPAARSRANPSE